MGWKLLNTAIFAALILSIVGCSATIMFEDEYDIRIINRTGDSVRLRLDNGSYSYIGNNEILIISSVDFGYHEISWEWASSGGRKKYKEVYKFKLSTDFEIVLNDDSGNSAFVIRD